jgi:hypothetical protein
VPDDGTDQVDGIHHDPRSAVVHDCVAVHVPSFTVGRRRRQALDDGNGQRLKAILPARGKSSGSGVLLSEAGRQSPDGIIVAEKGAVFGAEISAIAPLIAVVVVVVVLILVAVAFLPAVIVMIAIEAGKSVRYGGKREDTNEKESSIHRIRPADGGMRGQQTRARMQGWAAEDNRKDSPHKTVVGADGLFSLGERKAEQASGETLRRPARAQ